MGNTFQIIEITEIKPIPLVVDSQTKMGDLLS